MSMGGVLPCARPNLFETSTPYIISNGNSRSEFKQGSRNVMPVINCFETFLQTALTKPDRRAIFCLT